MAYVVLPIVAIYLLSLSNANNVVPREMEWSSRKYGPDGPWLAITVEIGTPAQKIDLYPGGFFESVIYGSSLCTTVCDAQVAGVYDFQASSTSFSYSETPTNTNASFGDSIQGVNASFIFDNLNALSPIGNAPAAIIPSFDMQVWTSGFNILPDGLKYSLQVGNLALGSPDINQTWSRGAGQPAANGTLMPSSLFSQGLVPSNSYGLHIGSAALGIPGSLYIGGYDQSRVLGVVTTQAYGLNFLPIDLLDISIGVAVGDSPFDFSSKSGLLAQNNSSIGVSLQVRIDSVPPYLNLPQSTCDAIATELPVSFQSDYGIYVWNTSDPQYEKIISSPSFLGFTFRLNDSVSQNVTINVPFSLLNLTLTTPLVSQPTQYFPCFPVMDSSAYTLGKAFLQAAFVGVTWQTNSQGVWFLAQAPGPNTPSSSQAMVVSIAPTDKFIIPSQNDWIDTWKTTWTPIGTNTTNVHTTKSATPSTHVISKGVIAGTVVGAFAVIAFLVSGGVFFFKRRAALRSKDALSMEGVRAHRQTETIGPSLQPPDPKNVAGFGPMEMEGAETGYIREPNYSPRRPDRRYYGSSVAGGTAVELQG